jgi:hypothetical protein
LERAYIGPLPRSWSELVGIVVDFLLSRRENPS